MPINYAGLNYKNSLSRFSAVEREAMNRGREYEEAQVIRQVNAAFVNSGETIPPPGREFFLAGKSCFTLSIPAEFSSTHSTPKQYVFRISKVAANQKYPEAFFVSMLVGENNETDYQYIGQLCKETGEVRTTHKSKISADSMALKLLNRALANVWKGTPERIAAAGFGLLHSGSCGRCGRLLTDKDSIAAGLGPTCQGKE